MFSFLKKALIPDTEEKVSTASTDANAATTNAVVPDLKLSDDSITRTASSASNGDSTVNDIVSVDIHSETPDHIALKGIVIPQVGVKSVSAAESEISPSKDLPHQDNNEPKIATALPEKSVIVSKTDSGNSLEIVPGSCLISEEVTHSLPSSSVGTTQLAPTAASEEGSALKTWSSVSKVESTAESSLIDIHSKIPSNEALVASLEIKSEKTPEMKLVQEYEGKHEKDDVDIGTVSLTHTAANAVNDHSAAEISKIEVKTEAKRNAEFEISEVDISSHADSAVLIPKVIYSSVDIEGMKALSLSDNNNSNSIPVSIPQLSILEVSSSHTHTSSVTATSASTSAPTTAESDIMKTGKFSPSEATKEDTQIQKDILKSESETDASEPCDVAKEFVTNAVKLGLGKALTESVGKNSSSECSAKTDTNYIPMTDVPKSVIAVDVASNGSHCQEKEVVKEVAKEKVKEKVVIDLTGDGDDNVSTEPVPKAAGTGKETGAVAVTVTGAVKGAPMTTRSNPNVVDLTGDGPDEGGAKDPNGAQTGQGTARKWAPGLEVWETCLNELVELEAMAIAGKLDHEGSDTEEGESVAYGGGSDEMTEDNDNVYGAGYEDEGKDEEYSGYSLSDEEDNDNDNDGQIIKALNGVNSKGDGDNEDEDDEAAEVYIGDDDEMVSYEDNAEEFEAQGSESGPKFSGFASEQEAPSRDESPLPPTTGGASDKLPIDAYREVILERIKVRTINNTEYGL